MNYSVPLTLQIGSRAAVEIVTGARSETAASTRIGKRLRAIWTDGLSDNDLGTLAGFSGGTSFSGTHASITLAWPAEKNPRGSGPWSNLLVPADAVRIKIELVLRLATGNFTVPLLTGVPSPDGISEQYGGKREIVEIKIEDVTGVAARTTDYTVPYSAADGINATLVAAAVLPVPYACLYPTVNVDSCLERFPNALAAADDALITQQDKLNPLTGQKRVRYGDRDGRIVYRLVEDSDSNGFAMQYPNSGAEFGYAEQMLSGTVNVEQRYARLSLPRINPYLDLGSVVSAKFGRAGIDENIQIREINWRLMPTDERQTIKGRREPAV